MQRVDGLTIAGWGLLLMPLLTMWHEIGGHAAACVALGGRLASVGAFYVDCGGLGMTGDVLVAIAGVTVNIALATLTYAAWQRASNGAVRMTLWLIWVSEAFVASGYFLFSGVTGFGDLGIGAGGSLAVLGLPWPVRVIEIILGAATYFLLVRAAIRSLNDMIGSGPDTAFARKKISHCYYISAGAAAVLVGLLNPVGLVITIMSATASSFGGLAGFISIGYATGKESQARPMVISRNWLVIVAGMAIAAAFAVVLGPSLLFA